MLENGANLVVNGTTFTVNSSITTIDDINLVLGSVDSPTDITAEGGGIKLKGTTDKSILWNAAKGWTSTEDFNLNTGKSFAINGTNVLNATTLGSGVVGSSLTSVGTLTSLTVNGTVTVMESAALNFRDTGLQINSSTNGQLDIDADVELELTAPTVDIGASTAISIDTAISSITSTTSHTVTTPSFIVTNNTSNTPLIEIKNTHDGGSGSILRLSNTESGGAGSNNDVAGQIQFYTQDSSSANQSFANIKVTANSVTSDSEIGQMTVGVACSDNGGVDTVLTILGGTNAASGALTVTGAASATTTVTANTLVMGTGSITDTVSKTPLWELLLR